MRVTLNDFYIADEVALLLKVAAAESLSLRQDTQSAVRVEAPWPTWFHDRAVRAVDLVYPVQWPPCASDEEAFEQARLVWAWCPKGGVLTETCGSKQITYEDAKIEGIEVDRNGLSNFFTFRLSAKNPTATTLSTLAQMDARNVINLYRLGITGLTGGSAADLDGFTTTDVGVGFMGRSVFLIGALNVPKTFLLITDPAPGVTAENIDPEAGDLVVIPDDYDEDDNAKIWVEA